MYIAYGGEEALGQFIAQPMPVVILDLQMLGMSAKECLRCLRHLDPQVKVIVVSDDLPLAREKLPRYGNIMAHLGKPMEINQLCTMITAVWPNHKTRID
ncbi:hypothetical protein DFAR_150020 [Desulfarculales bacterium]